MRTLAVAALLLATACSRAPDTSTAPEPSAPGPRVASSATSAGIARATLTFDGMLCEGCAKAAEQALAKATGVSGAHVDFQSRTATVEFDPRKTSVDVLASTLEHVDRSPAPPFRVTRREVER